MRQEIPYIGVTGIANTQEAEGTAAIFRHAFQNFESHQPATGYLVSSDTIQGKEGKNKKFPTLKILPELLDITVNDSMNIVHYCNPGKTTLAEEVIFLFRYNDIYQNNRSRILQLNTRLPDPEQIREIKRSYPDLRFVFSIGRGTMNSMTPEEVVRHLSHNKETVDYIMIDPSGGKGVQFEPQKIAPYFYAIKDTMLDVPVILAGGFSGNNLKERLQSITEVLETKDFGLDAESGLRQIYTTNQYDKFSSKKTKDYVEEAVGYFSQTSL